MKIGRLNRASFAKTARRAMFLFAFAALGTQAAMVAKVGETAYETLDEAITDVQDGETIVVNAGEYKLNANLTYTGKAFWGMQEYLKTHGIRNKKVLFLHTGGGPLFFDYLEKEYRGKV